MWGVGFGSNPSSASFRVSKPQFLLLYNGPFTPRQPGIQSKILT